MTQECLPKEDDVAHESLLKEDIVTVHDIAKRLDVRPMTVHQWRQRYENFPVPFRKVHNQWLWDWKEIQAWADQRVDQRRSNELSSDGEEE